MMDIKKICPFDRNVDTSRRELLKLLGIENLSEQKVSGIQIKYLKDDDEVTVSFSDCVDGDFIGAFFSYIDNRQEEKENGRFLFKWIMANDAWMCFGDNYTEEPSQVFEMFRRVRSKEQVLVKMIYK